MPVSLSSFDPEWSVPGYSAKDALSLCLASRVAYGRRRGDVVRLGFSDVEFFDIVRGRDIDTQGYIAINEERVLVAFRGTESIPDWLTNFQAVRDPGPWRDTNVHEGFQDAFGAAALKIGEIIGRRRGSQEVWVTGHSLGGALAVLLAATLAESKIRVTGLYTFAAPRVGNKRFAARLNAYLRRVRLFFVGGPTSLCDGGEAGGSWIRQRVVVVRKRRRGPVSDGTCAVSDRWGFPLVLARFVESFSTHQSAGCPWRLEDRQSRTACRQALR